MYNINNHNNLQLIKNVFVSTDDLICLIYLMLIIKKETNNIIILHLSRQENIFNSEINFLSNNNDRRRRQQKSLLFTSANFMTDM